MTLVVGLVGEMVVKKVFVSVVLWVVMWANEMDVNLVVVMVVW